MYRKGFSNKVIFTCNILDTILNYNIFLTTVKSEETTISSAHAMLMLLPILVTLLSASRNNPLGLVYYWDSPIMTAIFEHPNICGFFINLRQGSPVAARKILAFQQRSPACSYWSIYISRKHWQILSNTYMLTSCTYPYILFSTKLPIRVCVSYHSTACGFIWPRSSFCTYMVLWLVLPSANSNTYEMWVWV